MAPYNRILLKLSGEVMAGSGSFGIDGDRVRELAAELARPNTGRTLYLLDATIHELLLEYLATRGLPLRASAAAGA